MAHQHDHHHSHSHEGHHHAKPGNYGSAFIIAIGLNTAFVVIEFVYVLDYGNRQSTAPTPVINA